MILVSRPLPVDGSSGPAGVDEIVDEGYVVLYELDIPQESGFRNDLPVPYEVDNSATVSAFDRVAYYLELDDGAGVKWVYASMEAFTDDPVELGLPHDVDNPVVHQRNVRNLNVYSNVPEVFTGTFLDGGHLEIWPSSYNAIDSHGVFRASNSSFDWGDGGASTAAGYGSFQIHNAREQETILAYNGWAQDSGNESDIGIGSRPISHPDWTFAYNAGDYVSRKLVILVRPMNHEVVFSQLPRDRQLFSRDPATNTAEVRIAGEERFGGFENIILRVFREGHFHEEKVRVLDYIDGVAPFSFEPEINAELARYDFEVLLDNGDELKTVELVRGVVAGDAYLFYGQSNAEAQRYSGSANGYASPWLMTFGQNGDNGSRARHILYWVQAEGNANRHGPGSIGQWALVLGRKLVEEYEIPIAIINGSRGGYSMPQLQKDRNDPDNLNDEGGITRTYNRMRYRAIEAGVNETARAIFFYQGESDSDNAVQHGDGFAGLREDWADDYPGLEHFYVTQVRPGCEVTVGDVALRDVQRRFADLYPNTSVMASNALQHHGDNCHFPFAGGYRELGLFHFRQVRRDLYGSPDTDPDIDALNPAYAVFADADRSEVRLVLRNVGATVDFPLDALSDFVLVDTTSGSSIVDRRMTGGGIHFELSEPAGVGAVLEYRSHTGEGAWVTSAHGVGMLSFAEQVLRPDSLNVALEGFAASYERGDGDSGTEKVVFDYNDPDGYGGIEAIFNVLRVYDSDTGVEVAPETYASLFEHLEYDSYIRGLQGTSIENVVVPETREVSIAFTLASDAPVGDYTLTITSYDVTGQDAESVSLAEATGGAYTILAQDDTEISISIKTGSISGIVTSSLSGEGVAGALVSAGEFETVSGEGGAYTLNKLPPGTYDVSAAAENFENKIISGIEVVSGGIIADVDFALDPLETGSIEGTVQVQAGGGTLFQAEGVAIKLFSSAGGDPVADTTTGADGGFIISGIDVGEYTLSASLTGFETATRQNVEVFFASTTDDQDFVLQSSVTGTFAVTAGDVPLDGVSLVSGRRTDEVYLSYSREESGDAVEFFVALEVLDGNGLAIEYGSGGLFTESSLTVLGGVFGPGNIFSLSGESTEVLLDNVILDLEADSHALDVATWVFHLIDARFYDEGEYLSHAIAAYSVDVLSPDEFFADLMRFRSHYHQGGTQSGSERITFSYSATAGDLEHVFNVFSVVEVDSGNEIAPEAYDELFEDISFTPNQVKGLSGTDSEFVVPPGDLEEVGMFFTFRESAPLGRYSFVINSYDVSGIDPGEVSVAHIEEYRVLSVSEHTVVLQTAPDFIFDFGGDSVGLKPDYISLPWMQTDVSVVETEWAENGRALRIDPYGDDDTQNAFLAAVFDPVPETVDVEILLRYRDFGPDSDLHWMTGGSGRISGSAGSETAVMAQSRSGVEGLVLSRVNSGGFFGGFTHFAYPRGDYLRVRWEGGEVSAKVWDGTMIDEPEPWSVSGHVLNNPSLLPGDVGITRYFCQHTSEIDYFEVRILDPKATHLVLEGDLSDWPAGESRTFSATLKDAAGDSIIAGADSGRVVEFSQVAGEGEVIGLVPVTAVNGVATLTLEGGTVTGPVLLEASATSASGDFLADNLPLEVVKRTVADGETAEVDTLSYQDGEISIAGGGVLEVDHLEVAEGGTLMVSGGGILRVGNLVLGPNAWLVTEGSIEVEGSLDMPAGGVLSVAGKLTIGGEAAGLASHACVEAGSLGIVAGGELKIDHGSLALGGDGLASLIAGRLEFFHCLGSIEFNGDVEISGTMLGLISDVRVGSGVQVSVVSGGDLIFDGCLVDGAEEGFGLGVAAGGAYVMARSVFENGFISIDSGSVSIRDNLFSGSTVEVTAGGDGAEVYHNIVDDLAGFLDEGTAEVITEIDGWGNVEDRNQTENDLTLELRADGLGPGRTLDEAGNLYVQPGDRIELGVEVSSLAGTVDRAELLTGYAKDFFLDPVLTPGNDWQEEESGIFGEESVGRVNASMGYALSGGTDAAGEVTRLGLTAGVLEGRTVVFFRVRQPIDIADGFADIALRDAATPEGFLAPFTMNTGYITIDGTPPQIADGGAVEQDRNGLRDMTLPGEVVEQGVLLMRFDVYDALAGIDEAGVSVTLSGLGALEEESFSGVLTDSSETVWVGEEPYTRYRFEAPITAETLNGSYAVWATAADRSGNTESAILGEVTVNKNEIDVDISMQGFTAGTDAAPLTVDVTFVFTDAEGVELEERVVPVVLGSANLDAFTFKRVPEGTANVSAKAPKHLRRRSPAGMDAHGQGAVSFTGGMRLLGGDLNGTNRVRSPDLSILSTYWLQNVSENPAAAAADINGNGWVRSADLSILQSNWLVEGDPR